MSENRIEKLLRPLTKTSKSYYLFIGILAAIAALGVYAWWIQLTQGLVVTGMGDIVTWGLYISNFTFLVGVISAGILIGLLSHLGRFKEYKPIARISEVVALISLLLLIAFVIFDLARPDRLLIMFLEGNIFSPFVWDLVLDATYMVLILIAIYLPLRRDIAIYLKRAPKSRLRWLYKILAAGYEDTHEEHELLERTMWWLTIGMTFVMVAVHIAAGSWIFGIVSGRPGWFGPFVTYWAIATIATAISVIILVAAVVRTLFKLEDFIKPGIFKGLGKILFGLLLIYLFFMISEQVTVRYAGPVGVSEVSTAILFGEFAWLYWPVIIGFTVCSLILVTPKLSTTGGIVAASAIVLVLFWIERFLLLVPPLSRPLLPYPVGVYVPTLLEWAIMAGAYALGVLIFAIFIKIFPIIELGVGEEVER